MLKHSYQKKSIALLGCQSFMGKLILKRLITLQHQGPLLLLEVGKDRKRRQKFQNDPYFTATERQHLRERAKYVALDELAVRVDELGPVDLLFSCFLPLDFSKEQKVLQYHILKTRQATEGLKRLKIGHCVHLSSIYVSEAGNLSEGEEAEGDFFPIYFSDSESLRKTVAEIFTSPLQMWRWSLRFMEECYKQTAQRVDIIRVPSLGPTISNFQGYSPEFTYFTTLMYQVGSGIIKNLEGNSSNRVDVIPTDYVANLAIVLGGKKGQVGYDIVNLSTSIRNPINLEHFVELGVEGWRQYGNDVNVRVSDHGWGRKARQIKEKFPSSVQRRIGQWLDLKDWKIQGQKRTLQLQQRRKLMSKYKYFLQNQWICDSQKVAQIYFSLSQEEQITFPFNVTSIDWKLYIRLCVYCIKKHLLRHQVEEFKPQALDLLGKKSSSYFSDIVWALREGKPAAGQRPSDATRWVLASKAVRNAIRSLTEEQMLKLENSPVSYEQVQAQYLRAAEEMCVQMFSDYSMGSIRMFAWFLHKVFGTIYERVVIDKRAMARIRSHSEREGGPIVLVPTHRSYIDFLIMSYVFFGNGIKCPHIASAEDFLNVAVVHILLRKSGAFFIKRNQKKNKQLYKAIMSQYVSKILGDNHYLQFFIEGTRSRVGKMLPPKFGMLSVVVKNVIEGKIPDATILPVTINYEKVLEGSSFTYEMMGQAKVKESLSRVIKAVDVLKENYGRVYIELCEPISIRKYFKIGENVIVPFQERLAQLGDHIVHQLTDNLVITPPAIVGSVLLMNRKGISDDSLQEKVSWLSRQICTRGFKVARSQADSSLSLSDTFQLMSGVLTKSKKDIYEVQVSFDQNSFMKLFSLVYYRNSLAHIFFHEALIFTSLASFGHNAILEKGVSIDSLFEKTTFLANLLHSQFYLRNSLTDRPYFNKVVKQLLKRQLLRQEASGLLVTTPNSNHSAFCWSLIWPVVETYWVSCLYLFKLLKHSAPIPMAKFLSEIQWFGQTLVNQRIISHLEAISTDTIKNAVGAFTKLGVIRNVTYEYNGEETASVKMAVEEQQLKQLKERIEVYLKSTYAKSVKGILEAGQGSVNLDFPFLSKL